MVNLLPDIITKRDDFNFQQLIAIYQPPPRMEFIFHNSYATRELAVSIQIF